MGDQRRPGGGRPRGRGGAAGRPPPHPADAAGAAETAGAALPTPAPATVGPGDLIRLTIGGMAYGGEAVGRAADGTVVFVWGAMPGEEVLVEVTDRRKRFWRGQTREVLVASPERVAPPCPIFGVCGGCQWQFMAYPAQVEAKQSILLEQVRAAYPAARECLRPPVAMANPWHYRGTTLALGDAAGRPAFRRWHSHELVAVTACPIIQAPLNAALPQYVGDLVPGEELSLRCSAAGDAIQVWRGATPAADERVLSERVLDHQYAISPRSFFQINTKLERRAPLTWPRDGQEDPAAMPTSLTEDLVRLVLEGVAGYTDQAVIDAYCGVGLFTLPLAALAPRVIGIEEADEAVVDALANVAEAGLGNVIILRGAADRLLPAVAEAISAVVLDPPRTGVEAGALQAIIGKGVPRVVYVSCNPSTLGRDLRLLAAGGYRLDWLRLVDLFPQTLHIEAVAVLTLA